MDAVQGIDRPNPKRGPAELNGGVCVSLADGTASPIGGSMKVPGRLGVNIGTCAGSVGIVGAGARVGGASDCGPASQESPIRGSPSVDVPGT
jgi:hypothetical protein